MEIVNCLTRKCFIEKNQEQQIKVKIKIWEKLWKINEKSCCLTYIEIFEKLFYRNMPLITYRGFRDRILLFRVHEMFLIFIAAAVFHEIFSIKFPLLRIFVNFIICFVMLRFII